VVNGTIDLDELAAAIQGMTRRQALYKVLKTELSKKGYWKSLPRGNPKKGYQAFERRCRLLGRGK